MRRYLYYINVDTFVSIHIISQLVQNVNTIYWVKRKQKF